MDTNLALTILVAVIAAGAAAALTGATIRKREWTGPDLTPVFEAQGIRLDRLADALNRRQGDDADLRGDLGRTREVVESLRARAEEQRRTEEAGWEVIRRLESVLLGGITRGRAGENLLRDALAALPPQMVVREFRVNGNVVEFALLLPDGRRLPVDSKWAALREVEALEAEEDPQLRERLARDVEKVVARRAAEVAGYLDPSLTTPFAVACVPDVAYDACRRAHAEALAAQVILVPYSRALPVLLSLYALAVRYGAPGDMEGCLTELGRLLDGMEQTLENKVAKATTMLQNAADEWRTHVGKARGALARGRTATDELVDVTDEDPPVWRAVSG